MYHLEPEFRLSPMPVHDDRGAQNCHRLELPAWFYIRYPAHMELKPQILKAIRGVLVDAILVGSNVEISRMPSLAQCRSLHAVARTYDCVLLATQRPPEEFDLLVRRARATRTGRSS
jgi:hypothetical protein